MENANMENLMSALNQSSDETTLDAKSEQISDIKKKRTTELTFGQKAVGLTFNPSNLPDVDSIKQLSADLIDELDRQRAKVTGEAAAQFTLAIRKIQEGQMWGVKATTWRY